MWYNLGGERMTEDLKNILLKIIDNGFEAYIVGGYVRDFLLGYESTDIDICTNALPKNLIEIFEGDNISVSSYGSIKLRSNKYNVDITTYRKEISYINGKLSEIEYINDIETDIQRRDFTINALYMDIDGNIIDKVNGKQDINDKIIHVIGDINKKFKEDPLRILRALRFKITLGFDLDNEIVEYIHNNKNEIIKISNQRKKEEINKMLVSKNVVDGFDYLKNLQILDLLGFSYNNLIYVDDINGMYAQLNLNDDYPLTKEEKDNIEGIKEILDYKMIDYGILFKYGLYLSLVAGKILEIDKVAINELYSRMPIKNSKELDIDGDDIQNILNIEPSKIIKDITDDLIFLVLNKKLENKNDILKQYILDNKGMWLE